MKRNLKQTFINKVVPNALMAAGLTLYFVWAEPFKSPEEKAILAEIAATPLHSVKHNALLARASSQELAEPVYREYARIADRNPNDFSANLWAGVAAKVYWDSFESVYQGEGKYIPRPGKTPDWGRLQAAASRYLRRALELNPDSGQAHAEFGYWRFYVESDLDSGIKHLKEGIRLSPTLPRAHRLYAGALDNPSTKFYDLKLAEAEYKKAIALDARYVSPHFSLAHLYLLQKRYPEARAELGAVEKLLTPQQRQRPSWLRDALAKVP